MAYAPDGKTYHVQVPRSSGQAEAAQLLPKRFTK